jgi:glycerophosphoryl diester phosphodiesterase
MGNHHIELVCHKGANKVAPENTYAAAQQCIDWGAGTVEIDVWTSRDGELVLIHDDTVDRTTNGFGHVMALTAAELARLDAGRWFSPAFAGERIPVLSEFLEWIKGRARLFLDVKFAHPQQLLDLLAKTRMHDECFIWSGSDAWLELLHGLDPSMALKINVSTPKDVVTAHKTFGARIVEVSLDAMSNELVETCRERGIKTMIYEKEPAAFPDIIRRQPDMVNLDHADLFLQAIKNVATDKLSAQTLERSNVTTRQA